MPLKPSLNLFFSHRSISRDLFRSVSFRRDEDSLAAIKMCVLDSNPGATLVNLYGQYSVGI